MRPVKKFQGVLTPVVVGAVLRLVNLGKHDFWFDELVTIYIARGSLPAVLQNQARAGHPFLFFSLLHFWRRLGESEFFLRLLPFLLGVALIYAVFKMTTTLFGEKAGLLAAWIAALSPFQVYYAQELRMYSLVALLAACSVFAFSRAVERRQRRDWLLYGLTGVLGVYTHYYFIFLPLAFQAAALLFKAWRQSWGVLLAVNAGMALVFLPQGLEFAANQLQELQTGVVAGGQANLLSPLTATYYLLFGHTAPLPLVPVGLFCVLALLVLIAYERLRLHRSEQSANRNLLLLAVVFLLPLAVTLAASLAGFHIWFERTFTTVSSALIAILAAGIAGSGRRSPVRWIGGLLMLAFLLSLGSYYLSPDPAKPPLSQAAEYLSRANTAQSPVYHLTDASFLAASFYQPASRAVLVDVGQVVWLPGDIYALFGLELRRTLPERPGFWLTVVPGYLDAGEAGALQVLQERFACREKGRFGVSRPAVVFYCE